MNYCFEITLSGQDLEEKCSLLFEFGICGAAFENQESAKCYFYSESAELPPELIARISDLGLKLEKSEQVSDTNWVQNCSDLFKPVEVLGLNILPLRSSEDGNAKDFDLKKDLLIIPGTGFGTGHHATTFTLLKLLQDPLLNVLKPSSVLDAGSGSGILAIAAARLFDCKVDAYEVDPLAVENANENIEINRLNDQIELYCESVHRCENEYDLVIANLYAELLIMLCSHLVARGNNKAFYLLSGIKAELADGVISKYCDHGLECIQRTESDGWVALMLKRSET